ncbi:MAG: B12-binding domain-containing radical SAM protein [Spirochaetaceae bacterium]|nr:MAG: B12-binding domain-containing radical SAM protein [Spirochaetaceae bacterium]
MNTSTITLLNLNMLYLKYFDKVDREQHIPLGPLYLTRAIEDAGYSVDFRDYQLNTFEDPFSIDSCIEFLADSAAIIGISVMANLLPFALLLGRELKLRFPDKTIVLGGVGAKSVEAEILRRFPEIDIVTYGEGEVAGPMLVDHLVRGRDLSDCPNIFYRDNGHVVKNESCSRIKNLSGIPYPAYEKIDLSRYSGVGMITSRGCPFRCTFCSVAPVWNFEPYLRSSEDIIAEMRYLLERGKTDLFLFQDEYFLSSPERAKDFSRKLLASGLNVRWKAFGRVNLIDREAMELMAKSGCVEIRYGIESGCEEILNRTVKGFNLEKAIEIVSESSQVFPSVDAFFIWGFPFETMEQFYQTVFLMNSFRMMGVRVLPSLLCYLPQTRIYQDVDKEKLEFSYEMIPEYMLTGHETCNGFGVRIESKYRHIYDFILEHRDLFPGFFHYDIEGNIKPKLDVLTEFGFYRSTVQYESSESCGAHSPQVRFSDRSTTTRLHAQQRK